GSVSSGLGGFSRSSLSLGGRSRRGGILSGLFGRLFARRSRRPLANAEVAALARAAALAFRTLLALVQRHLSRNAFDHRLWTRSVIHHGSGLLGLRLLMGLRL